MMPYYKRDGITIHFGDALALLRSLDDNSVALIVTDPPYYKVKGEWWDKQWDTGGEFLAWIGRLCDEFRRVLKPNGSLYVFASPQMVDGVKAEVAQRFNVLNTIRWYKDAGWHKKNKKDELRAFLEPWEGVIFAEHFGVESYAKGEAGYSAKCDELRGFVFEPLRAYLRDEWGKAGLTPRDMNKAVGSCLSGGGMASHYIGDTGQWSLPTEDHYYQLRRYANSHNHSGSYLRREYEDLRREYEDLRREYEDLRRPFYANDAIHADLWQYDPVMPFPDKHPTEKSLQMMEDIIAVSSMPGDVVLDPFLGRGASAVAARNLGREFVGGDIQEKWCRATVERLAQAPLPLLLQSTMPAPEAIQGEMELRPNA